ncbi:zinc chelation protein SecC [Seongchinamella unica]|uniref:Zinc chelation protein SecC n=1 Tax=Seongchinamella unica TaxID=2547392 RepID=A0A4R5LX61_9GAMM|nr:aspartyl/asparaginyl beta-hydroxylase domain-containing protein [Seongchinamella unica]TDG15868.1 zinc chelation protein SecC [Seongchinamella unica]
MKLDAEFYRLPYRFDAQRLVQEVESVPDSSWIEHPDRHRGNMALPLISLNGEDNNLFHGPMRITPHLQKLEYIQQVLASLGEVYGRSRLMQLAPGCEVPLHTDTNYHWYSRVRIHVPITTTPEVIFHCADKQVHMGAGECWIFDAWQQHRVTNDSDQTRVHLVFDTAGSSRFWDMVAASERPCDTDGAAQLEDRYVPYRPGARVQVMTEKYNATPVKSPGEVDGMINDLISDYEAAAGNDPAIIAEYNHQLRRFARDWRMLFSLFGYEPQGQEQYNGLIHASAAALEAFPGSLVTASNGQDVRSIFYHRVLDAALEPDRLAEFLPSAPVAAESRGEAPRRLGRNEPCHCGSGRKYKHCHG